MKTEYQGLRTAIYKVTDLAKGKEWYTKVLGVKPYFDEVFYVGFNVGGYELGLIPEEKVSSEGGVTTYWGVDNVQKVFDNLISNGATAYENPNDVGGDIIVAAVKDPWGNLFGIIYNPHFKTGSDH
jgi:predicted enzyme related to lactoylglutathione lyase